MTISLRADASGTFGAIQVNGVDKVTVDSNGGVTVTGKINQAAQSMVRVDTANGYGSINNMIRRFTNVQINQGTDITYADSASLGASFTVNTNGVYAICYFDNFNTVNTWMGASLNASGTAALNTLSAPSQILAITNVPTSGHPYDACWTGYLIAGSVIRPHTTGAASGSAGGQFQQFTIARIA